MISSRGQAAIYFLENLCKFEGEPIKLYDYQKDFLLDESTYRIVNKARQLGFSWIIAAESVFEVLTIPNHTILIVSTGESSAKRVLAYCYKLFRGVKFTVQFDKETQEEIGLPNGSRIISLPNNPNCYSGDTEILTDTGWKRFDILQDDDIVAQVDKDSLELSYVKPDKVVRLPYKGDMYHLNNKPFDCMVTPNHRMLTCSFNKKSKSEHKKRIEHISELSNAENWMYKAVNYKGIEVEEFRVPHISNWSEEIILSGDDYCKFMGIWIAEGCVYNRKGVSYQVDIAQYPGHKKDQIREFLKQTGIKFSETKYKFIIWNKDLYSYLLQFGKCKTKFVPKSIKNARERQRRLFLDWYGLGDGNYRNGKWRFFTISKQLADDVQEILIKCGSGVNVCKRLYGLGRTGFEINEKRDKYSNPRKLGWFHRAKHIKRVNFAGQVYCVSVPTGLVLVRRNGKAIVCGNTVRGFNAGRVYIDESAHFLKDRDIFQAIQPSISRGGKMTLSSTPKGRANIFHEKWTDDDEYSHHEVPYTACPDARYQRQVKKMRKTMYEMDFKQEYCCKFMSDEMAMFPRAILVPCVDETLINAYTSESKNAFYMGIDFAKKVDSTVITILERLENKLMVVRHIKELTKMPYETETVQEPSQLNEITKLFRQFHIGRIKMDSTGVGVKLEEDLTRKFGSIVEGVRFGVIEKETLITNLRIAFEKKGLRIPDNESLISQLMSLEKHTTPSGLSRFKHVSGKHDDYVWSLALAVAAAELAAIDIACELVGEAEHVEINKVAFERPSIIAF